MIDIVKNNREEDSLIKLKKLYANYYPELLNCIRDIDGFNRNLSYPLLIKPFPSYFNSSKKIIFFGKETRYWTLSKTNAFLKDANDNTIVEQLLLNYERFHFGENYIKSPFWQFCHKLFNEISLEINNDGFIWNNIIKVDENGKTPKWDIIKASTTFYQIVQKELKILKPEIALFLTGKPLDKYLVYLFPGLKFIEITPIISQLDHPELPFHSYRTSHPKKLRMSKTFESVIKCIAFEIKHKEDITNKNYLKGI